jgi:hypothetical protein
MGVQPIFNYSSANRATRDGNVFFGWTPIYNPVSPWEGKWASGCTTGSGVFIDLPDKTGYVTFNRLAVGRFGYDYGGSNWNGAYKNVWYFYDYETLGRAAAGAIARESVEPSSVAIVDLPNDATKDVQQIAGSCFDPETRMLYVYSLRALPRVGYSTPPAVHVYYVREDTAGPEPKGWAIANSQGVPAPVYVILQRGMTAQFTALSDGEIMPGPHNWSIAEPRFAVINPNTGVVTVNKLYVGQTTLMLTDSNNKFLAGIVIRIV